MLTSRTLPRATVAALITALLMSMLFIISSAPSAQAADESAIASTMGKDFWISFQKNYGTFSLTLSITGDTDTSGTIVWPGGVSQPFTVTANTITTVAVPAAVVTAVTAMPLDAVATGMGIHVTAEDDVTIYGLNYQASTSDAFVAVPTTALGSRYRVLSYSTTIATYPSRLIVLSTQDATTVTVTPQRTMGSRVAGVPFDIELDAGEVYTLAEATAGSDVSGTLVTADRPIAVYGSVDCVNVGAGACDTLVQQMYSTDTWGVNFIAPRFPAATANTPVRVLADQDGTEVRLDGALVDTLDAGEFWEGSVVRSGDGNNAALIQASKPVAVGTYMTGGTSYGTSATSGDPAFLLLSPYDQFFASYTVGTPGTGFSFNGITVVVPTVHTASFRYNGSSVAGAGWAPVAGTSYSTAQIEVASGTYRLTADAPFGAFVYGANSANSYAYAGGAALSRVADVAAMSLRTDAALTAPVTTEVCIAVTVEDDEGQPLAGVRVNGVTSGANSGIALTAATIATGSALLCYVGTNEGEDTVAISAGVASSTTTVTWTPYADAVPLVVLDPDDVAINEGQTAYFETVVSGAPTPTVQWEVSTDDGGSWSDIAGATSKTLTVIGGASDDGNQYRVTATNTQGSITSGPATLTILPDPVAPTVSDPAGASVGDGDSATFTVTTTGTPTPTVRWQISTNGGGTWTNIPGATGVSYTTPATVVGDDGNQYRAVASNSAGGAFSAAATLTVVELPTVTNPADAAVAVGATATFTASAAGTPTPTVQWQVSTNDGGTWADIASATTGSYTTAAAVLGDEGTQYRLAATNTQGTRYSAAATLTILLPPTVTDPADATVAPAASATFSVVTTGSPAPAIQWQRSLDGGLTWEDVLGATDPSYTTGPVASGDDGDQYRAMVTNTLGTEYSAVATLRLFAGDSGAGGAGGLAGTGVQPEFLIALTGTLLLAGLGLLAGLRMRREDNV